jgi:hypothetical protein
MSWGPWDAGSGMVTPQVRNGFLARGIVPVTLAAGVAAFLDEVRHGGDEHHVVLGAGPWSGHGTDRDGAPEIPGARPDGTARATRDDPVLALDRAGS